MIANPFAPESTMPEAPLIEGEERISLSPSAGKTSPAEQGLEIPMGWKATAQEPVPVVRCHGTASTTGERCKRWSLRGSTVCRKHGAQLPSVREHAEAVVESARLQIMGMADDAVDVLDELLKPGVADAVRLKAVEMVLNRSGIKDAISFEVEVNHNYSPADEISKKLATMRARQDAELEEILDAEEVTEEPKE